MKTIPANTVPTAEINAVEEAVKHLDPESKITEAFQEVLGLVRRGLTVQVLSQCEELTPNEAAQVLNVSRPTILKMIAEGELCSRVVGARDQRISAESVFALKDRQAQASRDVAAAFANRSQAIDQLIPAVAGVDPDTARKLGY
ncbi:helix-turn-helix domain-containing protein [Pseudarthrobacter siccitolerans]|uniref:helix-turn-helix domain-containing protein n=1 Tax=Pseudarthrobacter siccitolerans TaxID=861266 RepID=UPI0009FB68C0|nr:helix-turn-helix domain-containing protein [Pseudarthrobacter siccitolerans]